MFTNAMGQISFPMRELETALHYVKLNVYGPIWQDRRDAAAEGLTAFHDRQSYLEWVQGWKAFIRDL